MESVSSQIDSIKSRQKSLMSKEHLRGRGYSTQEAFALALGSGISAVRQYAAGRTVIPDELKSKFCELVGVSLSYFLTGIDEQPKIEINGGERLTIIKVIGSVEAGIWKEAVEWPDEDRFGVPYPISNAYIAAKCYGLRVDGPSMNLVYPEGTVVIVCPLIEYPGTLENGNKVVVCRNRSGIIESTVKEVKIGVGTLDLIPRSTDPRYQTPTSLTWPYDCPQSAGLETVEITGIVIGSYRSEINL